MLEGKNDGGTVVKKLNHVLKVKPLIWVVNERKSGNMVEVIKISDHWWKVVNGRKVVRVTMMED